MNLVFVDPVQWDYDAATPYERPLGGSQSALCYLSVALVARGHTVTMYSHSPRERNFRGVQSRPISHLPGKAFNGCNAVILLNGSATNCLAVRPHLPAGCPLILWTQHDPIQSDMIPLGRRKVRDAWDLVVCVSQWHRDVMIREFGLDPNRVAVRRNAIGPAFTDLFSDAPALARCKSPVPILTYTSTPFRGLTILLDVFERLRPQIPDARLQIYSSMKVYFTDEQSDEYAELYSRCRSMAGVEYLGSHPQPQLAELLKPAWILSYPNNFAETSCIAVMEAMASGLNVVTSDLGALAETTAGMGILTPPMRDAADRPRFVDAYSTLLLTAIKEIRRDPQAFWLSRWEQVQLFTTQWTWALRAAEWEQLLRSLS